MALKEALMVFHGQGQNEYALTPNFGEGIIIKKIYVPKPVDDFLVIHIQKTLAGFWSLGAVNPGNNLYMYGAIQSYQGYNSFSTPAPPPMTFPMSDENVYNYFVEQGLFRPYRVAEGETITFRTLNKTNFDLILVYETYDSADVDPAEPNGSKSDEFDFVNYIYPSQVWTNETIFDKTWDPSEFPAFPVGERVPADYQITIWGIVGIPVCYGNSNTRYVRTRAIKFVRMRKVLYDEQKVGLPFEGDGTLPSTTGELIISLTNSVIRGHSQIDQHKAFILPQPLTLEPGEELEVRLVNEVKGSSLSVPSNAFTIGLLETVKRVR